MWIKKFALNDDFLKIRLCFLCNEKFHKVLRKKMTKIEKKQIITIYY